MGRAECNVTSCTYDTLYLSQDPEVCSPDKMGVSSLVPQTPITLSPSLNYPSFPLMTENIAPSLENIQLDNGRGSPSASVWPWENWLQQNLLLWTWKLGKGIQICDNNNRYSINPWRQPRNPGYDLSICSSILPPLNETDYL